MTRSVRPLRWVVAALAVVVVGSGLSGCVADPPPIIGTATAGDGQALLTWQPPAASPSPITGYMVTPWVGRTPQTPVVFHSTATTQSVTGLSNGVTYRFTVHALNAKGVDSAESARSNAVTPVFPIKPEFAVSDPVNGPNQHTQSAPEAAAFDGTNYLVVWADQRDYPVTDETWAARVAPEGTVLDPTGIRLPGGGPADVAFDGTNYLVVFSSAKGVAVVRVSPAGVVLDPTPIEVNANVSTVAAPSVSVGNGSALVVWGACAQLGPCSATFTEPGNDDVLAARIASDGSVLDPTPITLAHTAQGFGMASPDVAFDGTNYLVTFGEIHTFNPVQYTIAGEQVSGAGAPLHPLNILPAMDHVGGQSASLAFDGTNFVAVWSADYGSVRGTRIAPANLEALDPDGFEISATDTHQWQPAVAFDGTNTIVAWHDDTSGTMYLRRFDGAATPVDAAPVPVPGVSGQTPSLATDGGQVLYAFARNTPTGTVIDATRVDGGTIIDNPPFAVSTQANDQNGAAIVSSGSGSFVVWEDGRADGDIYGARVQDGSMLDGTGIPIATAAHAQSGPVVAFDGTGYLVVWVDGRGGGNFGGDIYAARVTGDGVVLDPAGIQITNTATVGEGSPSVAFDGTNYLVVWSGTGSSGLGVSAARVSTNGTVLDPGGLVVAETAGPSKPSVAFGGGEYLVAWQARFNQNTTPYVSGERLAPDMTVLDAAPFTIFHGASTSQTLGDIAFDGTDFFVVWENQAGGNRPDIFGARVTLGGAVLDPAGMTIAGGATAYQTAPHAAASAGGDFFVVWRVYQGADATAPDVYGARVTDAGVVLDPAGEPIAAANQGFYLVPTVAANGPGSWEVAYTRFSADPPYGSFRVFHRSVSFN